MGNELPVGWEESYDQIIGRYYINHFIRMYCAHFTYNITVWDVLTNAFVVFLVVIRSESTQLEDPRQEWKSIQEHMLHEYLTSAQDVLVAKKEIFDVKQQRLQLAQDEYTLLNTLAASRSSRKSPIIS